MDKQRKSLAIITRSMRSAEFLDRVLDGIIKQKGVDKEWVIVRQSKLSEKHKSCVERARNHGIDVNILDAGKNASLGKLANIGVAASTSNFIILHDDDDALRGNFALKAINRLTNDEFVAVACHAAVVYETDDIKKLHFVLSPGRKKILPSTLKFDNRIATNALIYRRKAFDQIGGYPEDVPVAEDWIFNQMLVDLGPVAIIPQVLALVYVREKAGNGCVSANTDRASHREMATRIRGQNHSDKGNLEQEQRSVSQRILRAIDRFTYKNNKWFLPRI
jgi:glycosyltransferase involved in cell wall biosynthesis